MVSRVKAGFSGIINFHHRRTIAIAQRTISQSKLQMDSKKHLKGRITAPLSTSKRQKSTSGAEDRKAEWEKAKTSLNKFYNLSLDKKKLAITQACVDKFYKSKFMQPLILEHDNLDYSTVFLDLRKIMLEEDFEPIVIPVKGKHTPDFQLSICASIVMYFAEEVPSQFLPRTVTEYFWFYKVKQEYLMPGLNEEEDLKAMIKMILPKINDSTIYHELGIGSGDGLLMLVHQATHQLQAVIGTDINSFVIQIFKIFINEVIGLKACHYPQIPRKKFIQNDKQIVYYIQ
jgi:hypothetical protein